MARQFAIAFAAVLFGGAAIYVWIDGASVPAAILATSAAVFVIGLIVESVRSARRGARKTHLGKTPPMELRHGAWIARARDKLERRTFTHPSFWLLVVFAILFAGSVYLFENSDIRTGPLYTARVVLTSLFAVTLGFLLSVWWSSTVGFEKKLREAERIDTEYRALLMSFSDSLFHIINALNALATKPPRPFLVATEFLLAQYVHLLQSRLHWYGDYIAGLGLDANDFLDEKLRIFGGIRERANFSVRGMPMELEMALIESLRLDKHSRKDVAAKPRKRLGEKFKALADEVEFEKGDAA